MRKVLLILILMILIPNISASCEEGQIDINTASAEELTRISHIGSSRAEQIIALKPFGSVDDMIRISGIGEIYLANIIAEGLACVNGIDEDEEPDEEEEENEEVDEEVDEEPQETESLSKETTPIELQTINLNPALHENTP